MEKRKTERNLKSYLNQNFGIIFSITILLFLGVLVLGILYLVLRNENLLIAFSIVVPVLIAVLSVVIILSFKRIHAIFYSNLFETTKRNYNSIYNEKLSLEKYQENEIKEFKDLNEEIAKIDMFNSNVSILNKYLNYSHIPLEYFSKKDNLVNEKTFKSCIKEIINCSQIFRNVIFNINFNIDRELNENEIHFVVNRINDIFKQEGLLIALYETKKGFYVYLPRIDSFSLLKEDLNNLFRSITITNKTKSGVGLITGRISVVVYPYSGIQDIFSDLEYANRQDKEIYIYIPEKNIQSRGTRILHSTANLNTMDRIISDLTIKSKENNDLDSFISDIYGTYHKVIKYLNIDEAGIILFDNISKEYSSHLLVKLNKNNEAIFNKDIPIKEELLNQIKESSDNDGTCYFSNRRNIDSRLGRLLDKKNVGSGFIYNASDNNGKVFGVIYFLNKKPKEILFDSYIRESLLTLSVLTTFTINSALSSMHVKDLKLREENLLKLSSLYQYTINKETHNIVNFSESFKQLAPGIKEGEKCYKALFGADKPCKNCPLVTKNKQLKLLNGENYQVSFSVNNKINKNAEFILKKIKGEEEMTNRFDPETAISSTYRFLERMKALYLTQSKGYVVTLTVDNASKLMKSLGNEGYSMLLRLFSNEVVDKVLHDEEIYLYKSNTLILVMPEIGKIDVIDSLENIYNLSKKDYLKTGDNMLLSIGYTAIKFPQEFTRVDDLIRHIERVLNGRDIDKVKTDFMLLEEDGFIRPASRKDYILSIADDAVKTDKLIIKMQPVVKGEDNKVFGSELLIRLTDVERDATLDTPEVIKIAAENDKLNNISDKLLNFVGDTYVKYGNALFRQNGVTRISINADYNYFSSKDFIKKVNQILIKNKVQKNFLAFEVTEKELAIHIEEFTNIVRELKRLDVDLICDQYTGADLSLDRIVELGIKEIKTDRSMCIDIDISTEKLNNVRNFIEEAIARGIKPTLLGIENSQQQSIIKSISRNINMQGYYFYYPMDLTEFTNIIKQNLE